MLNHRMSMNLLRHFRSGGRFGCADLEQSVGDDMGVYHSNDYDGSSNANCFARSE